MSSSDPNYGISRLDQDSVGTHGWQVRIQRRSVRYGRFFSDSEWGGKLKSLEVAKRFRDRIVAGQERRNRLSDRLVVRSHQQITRRNSSGVIGVTRISQKSAKGDEYHFWQASWTRPDGKRKTVRYSVLKLGEDEAFRLACEARAEAVGS